MASIPGPTKVPRPAFHKSNLRLRPICFPVVGSWTRLFLGVVVACFCWGLLGRNLQTGVLCFFVWMMLSQMILICFMKGSCNKKYVCCKVQQTYGSVSDAFCETPRTPAHWQMTVASPYISHYHELYQVQSTVCSVQYLRRYGLQRKADFQQLCFQVFVVATFGECVCVTRHAASPNVVSISRAPPNNAESNKSIIE